MDLDGSDRREGIWAIKPLWCWLAISPLTARSDALMRRGELLCSRAHVIIFAHQEGVCIQKRFKNGQR